MSERPGAGLGFEHAGKELEQGGLPCAVTAHDPDDLARLDIEGVLKTHSLEKYHNGLALILEAFDGTPLSDVIAASRLDLARFLDLAIKMAEIIGRVTEENPKRVILHTLIGGHRVVKIFGGQGYERSRAVKAANALRSVIVVRADREIGIAGHLAERIGQFGDVAGCD